jgi:hypothetical protein
MENVQHTNNEQQQHEPRRARSIVVEEIEPGEHYTSSPISQETTPLRKLQVINPFKTLAPRVTQLVYWENPIHSGAILAIGLSFLIYTAYRSLFNTFCALAFTLIGANWIYVIGRKQLQALINQKPVNPYENTLIDNPWYIERDILDKYLDITIEAINFILLEIQKIVLVDDPMRTIKYVGIFYLLWTFGGWISFRTLFGIGLVLGFVTPTAYKNNKTLVDNKLDQTNKFIHSHLDRGLDIAKQHTGGIYEKAKSFAADKGIVNGNNNTTQNTKKEE